uniref:Uncharacterized protein n=1 Tax=Mycena chlorophos TaxID=658473 RepID=A0ABQ0LNW4_MYCCL|nr:predicted protein [Mycena chlorophos]
MLALRTHHLRAVRHVRFKATAPPRPPRADLASIPQAIRELLPQRQERPTDPNAAPPKRRGLLFYLLLASPLFIWIQIERYFDPKPLLEKKRLQAMQGRLATLRETKVASPSFAESNAVISYLRVVFSVMLPPDIQRHMRTDEVLTLLDEQCPPELLEALQEFCMATYGVAQGVVGNPEQEINASEKIQDATDAILRSCYQTVHRRFRNTSKA